MDGLLLSKITYAGPPPPALVGLLRPPTENFEKCSAVPIYSHLSSSVVGVSVPTSVLGCLSTDSTSSHVPITSLNTNIFTSGQLNGSPSILSASIFLSTRNVIVGLAENVAGSEKSSPAPFTSTNRAKTSTGGVATSGGVTPLIVRVKLTSVPSTARGMLSSSTVSVFGTSIVSVSPADTSGRTGVFAIVTGMPLISVVVVVATTLVEGLHLPS